MEISKILQPPSQAVPTATSANLGKEDFLHLLTVQLRYQDPMNPMENTDFIAQMAQFSSLEQLQNMNQPLEMGLGSEAQLQDSFRNSMPHRLWDALSRSRRSKSNGRGRDVPGSPIASMTERVRHSCGFSTPGVNSCVSSTSTHHEDRVSSSGTARAG